jgi:hypothetical protein
MYWAWRFWIPQRDVSESLEKSLEVRTSSHSNNTAASIRNRLEQQPVDRVGGSSIVTDRLYESIHKGSYPRLRIILRYPELMDNEIIEHDKNIPLFL